MKQDPTETLLTHALAFMLGGLVGASLMVLLAPQSGEETRSLLAKKGQGLVKTVGNSSEELVNDLSQRIGRGRMAMEDYKSNVEGEAKSKSVQFGR